MLVGPGAAARELLERRTALADAAAAILAEVESLRREVVATVAGERDARTREQLAAIEVHRLRETTERNLRLQALADAGIATVLHVLDARPEDLDDLPGVGQHTARSAVAAAQRLAGTLREGVPTRIEPGSDGALGLGLVRLLHRLERVEPLVEPHAQELRDFASSVAALVPVARPARSRLGFALRFGPTKRRARQALASLAGWEPWLREQDLAATVDSLGVQLAEPDPGPLALWEDFEQRAAAYYALLATLVPGAGEGAAGHLPADLVERIADHPLDESLLRVNLRGYQAFGARFALNQGRALIGDEMGLGKTVQAIAVMAHLAATGASHFLVVCPASVLVNWVRKVRAHSTLTAHRVHGRDREAAVREWQRTGGVAVTTFEGLRHLPRPKADDGEAHVPSSAPSPDHRLADSPLSHRDDDAAQPPPGTSPDSTSTDGSLSGSDDDGAQPAASGADPSPVPAVVVVDEAHLVKNPSARRTREVSEWTSRSLRALFLTGTPLRNDVEELTALAGMLQPELVEALPGHLGLVGADDFRRLVAPVYLRRNLEDVLVELPPRLVVQEWEEHTAAGELAYREAVAAGNLMAMRRADLTVADPRESAKLVRLLEIVAEARAGGQRVVVFSFFRDVIDRVVEQVAALPGVRAHGPVTGSVPATRRQEMVDEFSTDSAGAVLVAQVQAGGVGLNVQAASVVVLTEPQLVPAVEEQAIGRVHRMGQVRPVQVHRLLIEDSVDERIEELLAGKREVFDTYARESSLAQHATAAVDVSQAELARQVVVAEQARLGYGPVWDSLEG